MTINLILWIGIQGFRMNFLDDFQNNAILRRHLNSTQIHILDMENSRAKNVFWYLLNKSTVGNSLLHSSQVLRTV